MGTRVTVPRGPNGMKNPQFVGKARPQYVSKTITVMDAARERMKWLFDEFDGNVIVSSSGGKDSTIVVELAAEVARATGAGPLKVWWLDQECEFQATVDYQRYMAYERDDIDFYWYQIPFKLENATNLTEQFLNVWGEGEEWMRPKEKPRSEGGVSIHENTYGEDKWTRILPALSTTDFHGSVLLDGLRTEESPARRLTCTTRPQYKWCTWSVVDKAPRGPNWVYRFHPVYDWKWQDVWRAIHENGWRYNEHYDHLFTYGVRPAKMRVSNFHHDQALSSLNSLQEIEPETWEKATRRLQGINTYGHLHESQIPTEVPYMFTGWPEYMHFLIDNLIPTEEGRETFRKQYASLQRAFPEYHENYLAKNMMRPIVTGDYWGTNVKNYMVAWRSHEMKAGNTGPVVKREVAEV